MQNRALLGLVAAGLAGGLASVASAQPFTVTISGATAQQTFLASPASTNDFIDVDGDGNTTITNPFASQLAPTINFSATNPLGNPSLYWVVTYREVGSGNGLANLVNWGQNFAIYGDGQTNDMTMPDESNLDSGNVDNAQVNRTLYLAGGTVNSNGNVNNPGGLPFRTTFSSSEATTNDFDNMGAPLMIGDDVSGVTAGVRVDIAPLDVPVPWFVTVASTMGSPANPEALPGQAGYGDNPRLAVNPDGTDTSRGNKLRGLGALNSNEAMPDANTVFSTSITLVPVGAMVNYGVGMSEILMSDLRALQATGRLTTGENLMAITRDSGSGTRNAFQSTICLDSSWGVGENIGEQTNSSANDRLGPNFQPSNKGGSSRMEATVLNHRLAIGHTAAARGLSRFLAADSAEFLAVTADLKGGTVAARPEITALLDGGVDGYNIIGPAVFATIGDPRSAITGNPAMPNPAAADYMNNIIDSLAAFKGDPGNTENEFSPGEFLAIRELSSAAPAFVPGLVDFCTPVVNPNFIQDVADFAAGNSSFGDAQYVNFTPGAGIAPFRTTGVTYSDGVANGINFVNQNGANVAYGAALTSRNGVAGDFNNDGARDWNDAVELVGAWTDRNGGAAWQPGTDAVIEILGDFTGDGNFDAEDVRYWADGLAVDPSTRVLSRAEGFSRVDNAFGGNFFGTMLATGASYAEGDSRADIAGNLTTRGYNPIGHDGVIDGADIDYVYANFGDWADLQQAVFIDLSADMNGDLVIDQDDVCTIVIDILGTSFGDVDLNGVVDASDRSIAVANLGMPGGWDQGDMNGDGMVDMADLDIIDGLVDPCGATACTGDLDGSGAVGAGDLAILLAAWGSAGGPSDLDGSGTVGSGDLAILLAAWGPCL